MWGGPKTAPPLEWTSITPVLYMLHGLYISMYIPPRPSPLPCQVSHKPIHEHVSVPAMLQTINGRMHTDWLSPNHVTSREAWGEESQLAAMTLDRAGGASGVLSTGSPWSEQCCLQNDSSQGDVAIQGLDWPWNKSGTVWLLLPSFPPLKSSIFCLFAYSPDLSVIFSLFPLYSGFALPNTTHVCILEVWGTRGKGNLLKLASSINSDLLNFEVSSGYFHMVQTAA